MMPVAVVSEPAAPKMLHADKADIEFKNLDFNYGEKPVLHNINLTVKSGQLVALVGASGSGKTSLLRCINLLTTPERGRIVIGGEPIFDKFNIEPQIERALDRKVWLKSGGYLVFDQAEALTAIDVNTGRFVGKHNQDETVLKTNLEAVEEVVLLVHHREIRGKFRHSASPT